MPLVHEKLPRKNGKLAIGSLGQPRRNPARPAVLRAGKVGEKGLGLTRACFCWLDGAFEGRAGELGGARRLPPRRRGNLAKLGRIQATRGGGSFRGVPGRLRVAGRRRNGGEGAVHRAATIWWPAAEQEAVEGAPCEETSWAWFLKAAGRSYVTPPRARS
jgi:hypothetical protein